MKQNTTRFRPSQILSIVEDSCLRFFTIVSNCSDFFRGVSIFHEFHDTFYEFKTFILKLRLINSFIDCLTFFSNNYFFDSRPKNHAFYDMTNHTECFFHIIHIQTRSTKTSIFRIKLAIQHFYSDIFQRIHCSNNLEQTHRMILVSLCILHLAEPYIVHKYSRNSTVPGHRISL